MPFSILRTLSDGSLHRVEDAQTLQAAKARIEALGEFWQGEYVILNRETGERVYITGPGDTQN